MAPTPAQGHRVEAEIFSTGEWNGERFGRADLAEIARNFEALRPQLQPPLKFGHDAGQTLLGQHDGDPALGWVDALRVDGERLVATFAGVPEIVRQAIAAGRYRRVSAELYFDVRRGGERLGKALKAVALLGADLPAVTNLADLSAYLHAQPPDAAGPVRAFSLPVQARRIEAAAEDGTNRQPPTDEEEAMSETETGAGLQAELAELRAYKARQERLHAEAADRRKREAFTAVREEVRRFCEEQGRAGRLPPHLQQRLLAEVERQAHSFSEGDGLRVSLDWVQAFVREQAPLRPAGEVAFARAESGAQAEADADPSERLARLARSRMAELNLSYSQAAEYVLRNDPDLARAYRDFTLNQTLGG